MGFRRRFSGLWEARKVGFAGAVKIFPASSESVLKSRTHARLTSVVIEEADSKVRGSHVKVLRVAVPRSDSL